MRNQINFLTIVYFLLLIACERQKEELDSFGFKPPKIVEAKKYEVSPEKTLLLEEIPVHSVKKIIAGKPETVKVKSNVFPAKVNRIIPAGTPRLLIPDGGSFRLPKVVPAIDSPFVAGSPEIILLKDPFIKEINPASFSSIKAIHGLNSNEISSLCQDKAGNLWIGEWWGGVSKYDGRFLTNYSVAQGLSSDVVNCIFEDSIGNLWIGTAGGGVNKFDGRYITHFSTKEGLGSNFVFSILQGKNGDMWFATGNGLSRFDGYSFTHYSTAQGLSGKGVMSIFEDSKGNLWAGTKFGLTRFDGHTFQNYTPLLVLNDSTEVLDIAEDNNGHLWFATNNNGIFKYDGANISQFTSDGGLSSNSISSIIKDNRGNLWICTWDRGVNRYDGVSFTHFGVEQGLGNETVPAIMQDKRGNIWLATTSGVSKYDGKLFSHIAPLRQEEVESLLADTRGNIWIGTGAGKCLNKYNGKTMARYTTAEGLTSTAINQIIEDRHGNIWLASKGGADKFDGSYISNYSTRNGLVDNAVYCLMEDIKGNLWFGTERGLSVFDGKCFTNYTNVEGLKDQTIYSLLEDHLGNIWIGTGSNGVYSFNGKTFTHYDIAHSVSHPMILGMIEDKYKNIWFCTGRGVNKFDGRYFTWYTTDQGLSNNIVKNVLEDRYGNIWVGTINGMNLLKPRSLTRDTIKNKSVSLFRKYTVSEGFSGGGTYENTLTQDNKGNIWIGATDRVALYHPDGDIPDTIPPTIQITGISLFNENINWIDAEKKKDSTIFLNSGATLKNFNFSGLTPWYNQPENLQLNYDNNYLTFYFIGITTYRPKEIRYQYMLEGLDKNWSNITDQPEATYSILPHGKYIFKVKAANSEGYWSKELTYPFVISPPLWQTWWAYLSYAAIFFVLTWLLSRYRSRQLKTENIRLEEKVKKRTIELEHFLDERYQLIKKVESQDALLKERLRISRELHDDIGSTLSSISIYSEVAKKRTEKKENPGVVLSKIGLASRDLIDKMSDIVWSLNPNNESFEQLQNRMAAFAAMILTERNIYFDFNSDDGLKRIQFTGGQRKNIFLIFKEALHNIVKYADCKTVHISLSLTNNNLIMEIKDDGKGFNVYQLAENTRSAYENLGGNGIKNMHARADDMNAKLCIHSTINEGTTIHLAVQL